jgi:serine/threonine-protein kinase
LPSCPRCLRALPDTVRAVCVYCGAPLGLGLSRSRSGPARAADALVGTTIDGRFYVEDLIGQGGMGEVYRARHLALDRTVVLKMLKRSFLEDPTLVGRFEREAKAASRLNHPNVIQVLDFGRAGPDRTLYIVMEHVDGKDLRAVLRDEWPLAEERLCHIMAQVCAALSEAHANNVIHRDLKPENIMVQERRDQPDFVKVLDFGIAKILDHELTGPVRVSTARLAAQSAPGLTRHDVVCGTPQYMAPEQATGAHLDARSDLYAVGVILYQMTTGHLPFDGPSSMDVLTKHVNEPPLPPRQRQPDAPISEPMEEMILRALEKDPSLRPQNAEQFREELLAIPEKARSRTTPPEVEAVAPPPARPMAPLVAGIALVVVALAAVAVQLLQMKP